MNKNTANARRLLAKAKKNISMPRLQTTHGSTSLTEVSWNLPYGTQPRKSQKECPKVARKRSEGMSLIDQAKFFHGQYLVGFNN